MKKITIFLLVVVFVVISIPVVKSSERNIVVDKSLHVLFVKNGQSIEEVIPVSIGSGGENETPTGVFHLVNKVPDPKWYFGGKVYQPFREDKENGLGVFWLPINLPSYGLHGTNEPFSPGFNKSHGCVRMQNGDVLKLAAISYVGEVVELREGENTSMGEHLKGIITLYNINYVLSKDN